MNRTRRALLVGLGLLLAGALPAAAATAHGPGAAATAAYEPTTDAPPWASARTAPAVGPGDAKLPPGGSFVDDDDSAHQMAIEAARFAGLTAGCDGEGIRYCPSGAVTRGQMATFLARAFDLPATSDDHFDDDAGSSHEDSINRVASAGLAHGTAAATYEPGATVTRQQMASFLARALGLTPAPPRFADVGGTHAGSIGAVAAAGVTAGCDARGVRFCPTEPVKRDQMASFLVRALRLEPIAVPPRLRPHHEGDRVVLQIVDRYRAAPPQPLANLTMELGPDLDPADHAVLEQLAAPAIRYFGPPRRPATVWASGDAEWLVQVLVDQVRLPVSRAREWVDDLWGLATTNTVLVDLPRVQGSAPNQVIHDVLIHELVHLLQYDLGPGPSRTLEPSWMVEGNATFFANILAYTSGLPWPAEPRLYASSVANRFAHRSLAEYEERSEADDGQYRLGALATEYLYLRYGEEKILEYWASVDGTDWKGTFERTFGIPVDRFYQDFERYRAG